MRCVFEHTRYVEKHEEGNYILSTSLNMLSLGYYNMVLEVWNLRWQLIQSHCENIYWDLIIYIKFRTSKVFKVEETIMIVNRSLVAKIYISGPKLGSVGICGTYEISIVGHVATN